MDIEEHFKQLATAKRAEITANEGTIREVTEQLSRLNDEHEANETIAAEYDKLAAQYAQK